MWVGWYVVIFLVVAGPLALIALLAPSGQKKDIIDIAQAIVTTSAIIVGGIWVWQEFTRERQGVPWLAMRQEITSFQIPEDQYALHIQTRLSKSRSKKIRFISKGLVWSSVGA